MKKQVKSWQKKNSVCHWLVFGENMQHIVKNEGIFLTQLLLKSQTTFEALGFDWVIISGDLQLVVCLNHGVLRLFYGLSVVT